MKKYLFATIISGFIVFVFGSIIPTISFFIKRENLNENVFWLYIIITTIAISIILSTCLQMVKYAPKIDNLEKEEEEISNKKKELNKLIQKYNELLSK